MAEVTRYYDVMDLPDEIYNALNVMGHYLSGEGVSSGLIKVVDSDVPAFVENGIWFIDMRWAIQASKGATAMVLTICLGAMSRDQFEVEAHKVFDRTLKAQLSLANDLVKLQEVTDNRVKRIKDQAMRDLKSYLLDNVVVTQDDVDTALDDILRTF